MFFSVVWFAWSDNPLPTSYQFSQALKIKSNVGIIPLRGLLCSYKCFNSEGHDFYGIANVGNTWPGIFHCLFLVLIKFREKLALAVFLVTYSSITTVWHWKYTTTWCWVARWRQYDSRERPVTHWFKYKYIKWSSVSYQRLIFPVVHWEGSVNCTVELNPWLYIYFILKENAMSCVVCGRQGGNLFCVPYLALLLTIRWWIMTLKRFTGR